jgi:hypothetical protein
MVLSSSRSVLMRRRAQGGEVLALLIVVLNGQEEYSNEKCVTRTM